MDKFTKGFYPRIRLPQTLVILLSLAIVLVSCRSLKNVAVPTIEFTKVPPAAQGGRERVDVIAGRVFGSRPGERIVVFARSGPWWVQPWPDKPFVAIRSDSTWSTPTHLGYEYAVLLVDSGYHPPPTLDVVPVPGGSIVFVKIVKGVGPIQFAPTKPLQFDGYDWKVRTISSDSGGTNNPYDPNNAWTDADGALHLRIKKKDGRWSCAELELTRSLGYGTYILVVRDTSHLEPATVLSMNTFDDWAGEQNFRQWDLAISRWGDAANKNSGQYEIAPFYVPGNVAPFIVPSGTLTHIIKWESGHADFKTVRGSSVDAGAAIVAERIFNSGVPLPGQGKLHLQFYVVASDRTPLRKDSEVVIDKFEYLP